MDVLINVVHQIGPLADGTPQEPLDVKGRPADSEHCNHDRWRIRSETNQLFSKVFMLVKVTDFSLMLFLYYFHAGLFLDGKRGKPKGNIGIRFKQLFQIF